jgi:hypothetical protein
MLAVKKMKKQMMTQLFSDGLNGHVLTIIVLVIDVHEMNLKGF